MTVPCSDLLGGTATAGAEPETLTIEKLREALDQIKRLRHPLEQWMLDQGKDPAQHFLFIAKSRKHESAWWPECVKFSRIVPHQSCLIVPRMAGLTDRIDYVPPNDILSGGAVPSGRGADSKPSA